MTAAPFQSAQVESDSSSCVSSIKDTIQHVTRPLIVIIGISDYSDQFPHLVGIPRDYWNIIYIFNYKLGYDVLYCIQSKHNKKDTCTELTLIDEPCLRSSDIYDNFRVTWTTQQIKIYNFNVAHGEQI